MLTGGKGHPRGVGTFARVLGRYVREQKALSLADAIAKMTLMPAQRLALKKLGRVQVGAVADLSIFDADKVADRATYAKPAQVSTGFQYVLVSGRLVVNDGRFVEGSTFGRPIRGRIL